ncbi:electron transfer flavoprotein subunit alpha/FixB family protein [Paenibacillus sp. GD4]|jgi:electron transfer flavoprotein alpha subunit|uniref:electron transfer flavoprotein subunit alpha/FixB family protein n=1 Tax=Paenibacillus sp. GD4 TaxID=3068890 RepID=UPI0027966C40|nr:electron transfer flavoprotein subunit alpha/FixB family protein [Paenibacillus sp. GD4]MDQ1909299.1 electron transfer flavoprotein subunit alpha/FixB family protein [Paenibacillus sp. GD4]
MSPSYWIVAEARGGKLRQVTLEIIQAARAAKEDGDRVEAILIGHQLAKLVEELQSYGLDRIYAADAESLAHYNPETYYPVIASLLAGASEPPRAVFFPHTATGRDLAPKVAAQLGAGQISDVIALEKSAGSGELLFTRPLYAGKAFEQKAFLPDARPMVVTFRPNNLPAAEAAAEASASADVVNIAVAPSPDLRTVVKDVVRKATGKVDLTEARIVVSGGRGVKSADGFQVLDRLAEVLGAAVGASRGACDAGYCDYALQIGQTGKVVTPEVYIACGISGAIQHLAGMSQSRIIIAINKDPEAPIFKLADYGIVGDLFEIVPLLTEEFKKALS